MTTRLTDEQLQAIREGCDGVTPGPWRRDAMGGSSTVLSKAKPPRNDTRIPTYGYRENGEHCLGYPWVDEDRTTRFDFVCFGHDDAGHIARLDPETVRAMATELIERRAGDSAIVEACAKVVQNFEDYGLIDGDSIGDVQQRDLRIADAIRALAPPARTAPCPRPMNDQPQDQTVGECHDKGLCGCGAIAPQAPADQTVFPLNSEQYASFAQGLEVAAVPNEKLCELLSPPAPAVTLTREQMARDIHDKLNAVAPAVEQLASHQIQADADGVMVKVSRQALDEVLETVNSVAIACAAPKLDAILAAQRGVTDAGTHTRPNCGGATE